MDGLSLDPSHWWRDHRLTKYPMPMPQLLTSRSPPNYTFLWLRFMGTYISRGVCTQQVLTNGFLYFAEFRIFPKYEISFKGRGQQKKTFSFGHCPNHLKPPPMTPIRATWSSFFGSRNSRFESQFRTKNTICTI